MIPLHNIKNQHDSFLREYMRDVQQLFTTCDFIGSSAAKPVLEFEKAFAEYIGVKHAIAVNSGTDALLLALDAVGVRHGDEVIMPAFGFIATADVVVRLGATPVFVDIDPVTFNIDPKLIEAAITDQTKAIIPVHLYGQACDMAPIKETARQHGIAVIEDVAQACGTEYKGQKLGALGTLGAFSFYPTKNLGAAGDAGAITTNSDELADRLRKFRDHGRNENGKFEIIGYNSRLDSIQALYLSHKLPELDDMLVDRQENARLYNQLLADSEVDVPAVPEDNSHTFNLYTVKIRDRNRVQAFLREKGIASAVYYPETMPEVPALSSLKYEKGQFPASEEASRTCLSLPVWPGLKKKEIEQVVKAVNAFLANNVSFSPA